MRRYLFIHQEDSNFLHFATHSAVEAQLVSIFETDIFRCVDITR